MKGSLVRIILLSIFPNCVFAKSKTGSSNPKFCRKKEVKDNLFSSIYNSSFSEQATPDTSLHQYEKKSDPAAVQVTLYYESLCPDCKQVIMYQLYPTYQKLASSQILNVELVPHGNAQERQMGDQWVFYCQHGASECLGNLIETCSIHHSPKESILPYIYCLEYYGPTLTNGKYCAGQYSLPWDKVESCVYGAEGNNLQHEMALKTEALNPPHQYVPWFTMNGVHSNEIQNGLSSNMLTYVCDHYTGSKPQACVL